MINEEKRFIIKEEDKLKTLPIEGSDNVKFGITDLTNVKKNLKFKYTIPIFLFFTFLFWLVRIPREIKFDPIYILNYVIIGNFFLLLPQILFVVCIIAIFMVVFKNDKLLGFGIAILTIFIFMAIFASVLAPYSFSEPTKVCGDNGTSACRLQPPNSQFIMGTTIFGLDVYSRVLWGAQIPLQMSFIAAFICFIFGVPLGLIGGYYGGKVDNALKAMSDVILSFPPFLLALSLTLFLADSPLFRRGSDLRIILVVSLSVGLLYIPTFYVIVRSIVLQMRELAFVEAAKSLGARNFTIMFRYILPNVIAAPIAIIPFVMTDSILTGASLAFLGIGISAPTADWGYDMTKGIPYVELAPWLISYPGIMLFLLAFSFSLIGDSLNEKFNPQIQKKD